MYVYTYIHMYVYTYIHTCMYRRIRNTPPIRVPTRVWPYKIVFMSRLSYTNQYYYLQTAPLFGQPLTAPHRPHYCAIYYIPPTSLYCNICHIVLVMTIV